MPEETNRVSARRQSYASPPLPRKESCIRRRNQPLCRDANSSIVTVRTVPGFRVPLPSWQFAINAYGIRR